MYTSGSSKLEEFSPKRKEERRQEAELIDAGVTVAMAEVTAQLVKCLLRKYENLTVTLRTHLKSQAWWYMLVVPYTGQPSLLSEFQGNERPYLKKYARHGGACL